MTNIRGYCPMGCGQSLVRLLGFGEISCLNPACPNSAAVDQLLNDPETEHIVVIGERTFETTHPLRERLDDSLFSCELHRWLFKLDGPPAEPGRYRVTHAGSSGPAVMDQSWTFEELE